MCIKEKLSKVVFDEKAKSHIEERHIEEWGGKSRFIIPKEGSFRPCAIHDRRWK